MFYVMVSVILPFAVRMLWRRSFPATRGIRQCVFLECQLLCNKGRHKKSAVNFNRTL